jgi:hypothetical protein
VSHTWDSTVNNMYDAKCAVNKCTPMTPSERACAASHLKVWRTIAHLRETLFNSATGTSTVDSKKALSVSTSIMIPNPGPGSLSVNESTPNDGTSTPYFQIGDLESVSRGCYRFSRMGGGWIQVPSPSQKPLGPEGKGRKRKERDSVSGVYDSDKGDSENDDWYLILEDDAEVARAATMDGLQATLNKIIHQKLPYDFDICYLGHVIPQNSEKTFFRGGEIVKINYAWCLHAYILRGKSIKLLLNNLPINAPVDNFIAQLLNDEVLKV